MAVTNLLKFVLHWTGYGEEGTISWHIGGNAAGHSNAQLADAAGNVLHLFQTAAAPSTLGRLQNMLTADQAVDTGTLYEYAVDDGPATGVGQRSLSGITGNAANCRGPLQTCIVASLRTAQSGRSYRGRQYFPGHVLTIVQGTALISPTDTNNVASLAATMGNEVSTAVASSLSINTAYWGVYSRTQHVITPITQVTADNRLDTQRRREANLKPTSTAAVSAG